MAGYTYSAKVPTIINYVLTLSNTWYAINTENKAVRRWFMRARDSTDFPFDYDFTSTHTTYMTNSGAGVSFDGCSLPVVYCRSATANVVIELIYWD